MGFNKFLLFTSLSIILLTEAVWAVDKVSSLKISKVEEGAVFSLNPATTRPKVGEIFTVDVVLETGEKETVGADAKIAFDPNKLQALAPKKGEIFEKYPLMKIDNQKGEIDISGVSQKEFSGQGIFAKLSFKAKERGKTFLEFLFKPSSTVDSNIALGGQDILQKVKNAIISIKK